MTIDELLKNGTISLTDTLQEALKKSNLTSNGYYRWNEEQDAFIQENAPNMTQEELRLLYIEKFNIERTSGAIAARVKKLKCTTKKPDILVDNYDSLEDYHSAIKQGYVYLWTNEQIEFLTEQVKLSPSKAKVAYQNKFGNFRSDAAIETKIEEILENTKYTPKSFKGRSNG